MRHGYWLSVLALLALLAGCKGDAMKDGVYKAQSSKDERGAYGEITVNIKDGKIADCQFVTWQANGELKDENYAKSAKPDFYKKAQIAVAAMKTYADELVTTGDPAKVDSISGASVSYEQFQEAAKAALSQARQKD